MLERRKQQHIEACTQRVPFFRVDRSLRELFTLANYFVVRSSTLLGRKGREPSFPDRLAPHAHKSCSRGGTLPRLVCSERGLVSMSSIYSGRLNRELPCNSFFYALCRSQHRAIGGKGSEEKKRGRSLLESLWSVKTEPTTQIWQTGQSGRVL